MSMDKRFRILVVDDEPLNIQLIAASLNDVYDVFTARDGFDAISQLKEHKPDLILLDVMMPDLSGFDVCRIIKADEAFVDLPILFLTAMDSIEGEMEGLGLGGIDYLTKPVNLELLKLRVHNHIELKKRNELILLQRDLLARRKAELESALSQVKCLESILPICMYCKKFRDDTGSEPGKGKWMRMEEFLYLKSGSEISHGCCLECYEKHKND